MSYYGGVMVWNLRGYTIFFYFPTNRERNQSSRQDVNRCGQDTPRRDDACGLLVFAAWRRRCRAWLCPVGTRCARRIMQTMGGRLHPAGRSKRIQFRPGRTAYLCLGRCHHTFMPTGCLVLTFKTFTAWACAPPLRPAKTLSPEDVADELEATSPPLRLLTNLSELPALPSVLPTSPPSPPYFAPSSASHSSPGYLPTQASASAPRTDPGLRL